MNYLRMIVLLSSLISGSVLSDQEAESIAGFWVTPDGAAVVEVRQSGPEAWVIRIAALREPEFTESDRIPELTGRPRTDIKNPEVDLRDRLLISREIGYGFDFVNGSLRNGRIYDPGSGKTYRAELKLTPGGLMEVRGFVGFSILGKTMYWFPYGQYRQRVNGMVQQIEAMHEEQESARTGIRM